MIDFLQDWGALIISAVGASVAVLAWLNGRNANSTAKDLGEESNKVAKVANKIAREAKKLGETSNVLAKEANEIASEALREVERATSAAEAQLAINREKHEWETRANLKITNVAHGGSDRRGINIAINFRNDGGAAVLDGHLLIQKNGEQFGPPHTFKIIESGDQRRHDFYPTPGPTGARSANPEDVYQFHLLYEDAGAEQSSEPVCYSFSNVDDKPWECHQVSCDDDLAEK